MPFIHISDILDDEKDDDEIEDLFLDFKNNLNLNIPTITDLKQIAETINQDLIIDGELGNDMSLEDSQSATLPLNRDPRLDDIPTAIHGSKELQESLRKLCLEFSEIFSKSVKAEPALVPS